MFYLECLLLFQLTYMPRTETAIARQVTTNSSVRDYFILTNLRYNLRAYITPASFDRNTADPTKYFFAVRDFDFQASCYCNGMSDQCQNAANLDKCICQKNTQGNNCELCNPLFNNKPWRYGIACEACNCSGLSQRCTYDSSKGHGVCQGCTRNTTGDFCQQCVPGYHRNSNNLCVSCGCNISGVSQGICNETTGVCICKQNVEGSRCETCKDQFFGLRAENNVGCSACNCTVQSTINESNVCNKETGQCPCSRAFSGRACDVCATSFYRSQPNNLTDCRECFCDPSGSLNTSCSNTGVCYCRPSFSGPKCETLGSSYFTASVAQSLYTSLSAIVESSVSFYYFISSLFTRQFLTSFG